jgi:hypothetical protein
MAGAAGYPVDVRVVAGPENVGMLAAFAEGSEYRAGLVGSVESVVDALAIVLPAGMAESERR